MSLDVYYMWNFKPNEKESFFDSARAAIMNNRRYTAKNELITPEHVPRLLAESEGTFPGITDLYNKIPAWVTKADLVRLLKAYCDGGTYCDTDCFIRKNFDDYTEKHNAVVFTECTVDSTDALGPRECKNAENKLRVANYFFYSKSKKHSFFRDVIAECLERLDKLLVEEDEKHFTISDILWTCGPDVITSIYHSKKHTYDDLILCDTSFLDHAEHGSWRLDA